MNYDFLLKNLDYKSISKYKNVFNYLNIKYKIKDNNIYIYLKLNNTVNFIYNLLLISIITNIYNLQQTKLKLNKIKLNNNVNVAKLLIKIFNYIKTYNKQQVKVKNNDITEKGEILNLNNNNCILEDKNKLIKEALKTFLTTNKYKQLQNLIELTNKKSKNVYLKKFNNIIKNNLQITTNNKVEEELELDF